jgi:hypothetical protein
MCPRHRHCARWDSMSLRSGAADHASVHLHRAGSSHCVARTAEPRWMPTPHRRLSSRCPCPPTRLCCDCHDDEPGLRLLSSVRQRSREGQMQGKAAHEVVCRSLGPRHHQQRRSGHGAGTPVVCPKNRHAGGAMRDPVQALRVLFKLDSLKKLRARLTGPYFFAP